MIFLSIAIFISACTSHKNADVGVIELHDDYTELNGERFSTIDELVKQAVNYSVLHINVHPCLDARVFLDVMEKVKKLRNGLIHVGSFGRHDDGTCN